VRPITSLRRRLPVALVVATATIGIIGPMLPSANASIPAGDPLPAASDWGIYKGSGDGLWPAYQQSSGHNRKLLAKMALHARSRLYGQWISTGDISGAISKDIAQEQNGNPNVLMWMSLFRLWPGGENNGHTPLSPSDQNDYRAWMDAAVRGIGSARVGVVLEPDLPLVYDNWSPKTRLALTRYAAQELGSLPNATVYIDAGSADWLSVSQAASMLERAGIQYVRGFSLGATHHDATASEIRYARAVGQALARAGYPGKHAVIDTADNGHGYTNKQFYERYPRGTYNSDNPPACTSKTERAPCVALGIPPTTDVTNSRWKLSARVAQAATHWVDAYVWLGHPWKINNGHDFDLQHALDAARTDPYF
jgi:hypothetical protein